MAYAEKVAKPGTYLDALDAQLIASLENRILGIAVDSPAESLEPVPASRYLQSICP